MAVGHRSEPCSSLWLVVVELGHRGGGWSWWLFVVLVGRGGDWLLWSWLTYSWRYCCFWRFWIFDEGFHSSTSTLIIQCCDVGSGMFLN